jgi:hypothetical protein
MFVYMFARPSWLLYDLTHGMMEKQAHSFKVMTRIVNCPAV